MEQDFLARIKTIGENVLYIGIPAESIESRKRSIRARADKFTSERKKSRATKNRLYKIADETNLGNAYLLYIFSKGSVRLNQPPRPVLEPAIHAPWNKRDIADLVAQAVNLESKGQHYKATQMLNRAGARAAKAARDWFDDPRNQWSPNAPTTVAHKGFDKPGIDTSAMRNAITYFLRKVSGETVQVKV